MVALPLIAALAGCDASSEPVAATSSAAPSAAAPRAIDTPDCAPDGTRAVVAGTDDTVVLTLGEGAKGIVFAPQSNGNFCQWSDQMVRYAAAGYRVASFGWGADGAESLKDAVAAIRDEGAEDVVLVGASKGAGVVAGVADDLDPAPVGVIALSPGVKVDDLDATSAGSSYTGPLLVIASVSDGTVNASESKQVARADDPSTYVELPGGAHGVSILLTDTGPQVLEQMDTFVAAAFGA
ncbi:alpha/beta hydrolase [Cellulomonas sp. P22]|uniref:alpha/beta hydrolase n=1 Tax=Cellulomonas sp. P22 TaxID=3373189 RepID=UPI00378A4D99